jgi:hypothetical protein
MICANRLDVAYGEYDRAVEKANKIDRGRQVSWNSDEEDAFVGVNDQQQTSDEKEDDEASVSSRAIDFCDLLRLFEMTSSQFIDGNGSKITTIGVSNNDAQCNNDSCNPIHTRGNIFLFGGSAKTGEGVKSAMEYLVTQSKKYRMAINSQ